MKESLSPYIDSFLTMIAVEKGLTNNTVDAYSRVLVGEWWLGCAKGGPSGPDPDPLVPVPYFGSRRSGGCAPVSISRHIVTVRQFYGFLETEGVINENPVPPFHLAAGGRKLPQTL